jgi:hypothetical protein
MRFDVSLSSLPFSLFVCVYFVCACVLLNLVRWHWCAVSFQTSLSSHTHRGAISKILFFSLLPVQLLVFAQKFAD